MAHRGQPGVSSVRGRDAVDLDALRVHGHSQQGHVVFPADHRTQPSERSVEDRQRGCVAEAPHEPLGRGRHDLAMLAHVTVWRDEYGRAVESASLALYYADDDIDPELGGEDGKLVYCGPWNVDRALPIPAEVVTTFGGPVADHSAERDATGIAGDERFRKQHEASSPGSRIGGQFPDPGKRGGAIEHHRCSLNHRDTFDVVHDSLPVDNAVALLDWSSSTSRRVTGTATPVFSARLSNAPPSASSSSRRPAAWSRCIDDSIDSGAESSKRSTAPGSMATPSALATAATSPISAIASVRRLVRIAPTLARSCVVSSAIGASTANLSHNMASSFSRTRTSRPAVLRCAAIASTRSWLSSAAAISTEAKGLV